MLISSDPGPWQPAPLVAPPKQEVETCFRPESGRTLRVKHISLMGPREDPEISLHYKVVCSDSCRHSTKHTALIESTMVSGPSSDQKPRICALDARSPMHGNAWLPGLTKPWKTTLPWDPGRAHPTSELRTTFGRKCKTSHSA